MKKKISSQVPTPEELQILIDAIPDFAINKDAVRVIRDFTAMENERVRWVVDIYYLPGMTIYGPDSYFEMSAEYHVKPRDMFSMSLKMSNPYKHRFGHFANNETEFNVTVTGTETREIAKAMDLGVGTCIYEARSCVKGITTVNLEWKGKIENLKIFSDLGENVGGYYRYGYDTRNWSGNYFTVVDGDTLELTRNIQNNLELEHYTAKGQDGIEYSLMPNKYHESIDDNLPYELRRWRWYRMTYPKPDGKKMDVLIPANVVRDNWDKMNYDNIKENLNVAFLDSIFNETFDAVVIAENGEMLHYKKGLLASEYDEQKEQRKEAEDNAKWEAFWEDMAKQYGKAQANMFRNSDDLVMKGLDIRLLIKYTAFMYEEWNRNVGAVKFYRTDADGYGIFILYKLSGAEIWIRTKNNKIYDWTLYSND